MASPPGTLRLDRAAVWTACLIGLCAASMMVVPSFGIRLALAFVLFAVPVCWLILTDAHRWLVAFFAAVLLLPPLPLPFGDSGPHAAAAIAGIGLLAGLLRLDAWRIAPGGLFWPIASYTGVLFLSVPFALFYSGWAIGLASLVRVLLFGISSYVFLYSAYGPPLDARRITRLLYLTAAAAALIACVDFYFQWPVPAGYAPQFVWLASGVFRRAQGMFYEASTLGNFCAFFLSMAALCLLRAPGESPVSRTAALAGIPVFATALLLSFSRASLVNLAVSSATLLWMHRDRVREHRLSRTSIVVLAGSGVLACVIFSNFVWGYLQRLWFSASHAASSLDRVLSGRLESWDRLCQFLSENRWVFVAGVGYKTLPYTGIAGEPIIVDNMYFSLLAETGVAGLGCFLVLNAAIMRTAWQARRSFYGGLIFAFWAGQMVQMLSGDLFTYWRVTPVYFWVLGQIERTRSREHSPC